LNKDEIQRFQKKFELDIITGCWLWKASKTANGYGHFRFRRRLTLAHRLSFQHWNGNIPKGLDLDHLCRNRACVNPQHLEAVTRSTNLKRGLTGKINNFQTQKTHCPKGHELKEPNLDKCKLAHGIRRCKTCNNESVKQYCQKPEIKYHRLESRKQLRLQKQMEVS